MDINGHILMSETQDILIELRRQLDLAGIKRFNKIITSGNNLQTNCPFHKDGQERKPSFGINKNTGECNCFGCGWKGHITEMISNCLGYDDFGIYGEKWLLKNFVSISIEERQDIDLDLNRKTTKSETEITYVSEEELDSYRYVHPYMYKRKLTDEIIEMFDIGYDKNTDCITFPNRDINGNCLFVARRSVRTKFFNYPQNAEKPVYGLYEYYRAYRSVHDYVYGGGRHNGKTYAIHKLTEIIICESMIDALTCWVYGKYAVALNGLGNDLQFKQLRELPCRKFILATDMDERGLAARSRIRKALGNKLVTEYRWDVKIAKDINDMDKDYFDNLEEYFC